MALLRRAPQTSTAGSRSDELVPALLGALVVDEDNDDLIGPFADAKARADDLLAGWLHGDADKWSTGTAFVDVRVVAANGTEWTIGATSGLWFSRTGADAEWVPAMVPNADEIAALEVGGPLQCAWVAGALTSADNDTVDAVEEHDEPFATAPADTEPATADTADVDIADVVVFDASRLDDDVAAVDDADSFFADDTDTVDLNDVLAGASHNADVTIPEPSATDGALDAGWYEDPDDVSLVRWWDGSNWTANTLPNPNV